MSNKIAGAFERLLGALQSAERRHREAYETASDNHDWEAVEQALRVIPSIVKWRKSIDQLQSEIASSGFLIDDDITTVGNLIEIYEDNSPLGEVCEFDSASDVLEMSDNAAVDDERHYQTYIPEPKVVQTKTVENEKPNQAQGHMQSDVKFVLFGDEYSVNAWNDVFFKVCEILLLHRPYLMASLDRDVEFNTERRNVLGNILSEIRCNGDRLSNGIHAETLRDVDEILDSCYRLLDKCGISPQELQVC